MRFYYIVGDRIMGFTEPLDSNFYTDIPLTDKQSEFYEANPNASIGEILEVE